MSVTVRLEDDLDVSRGDMICRPHNHPHVERDLDATLCWMSETPSATGGRYVIKHTTRTTRAVLTELAPPHRRRHAAPRRGRRAPSQLNDIGRVTLRTATPLAFDPYRRNRTTGSFILIDEATNDTVAAGMILGAADTATTVRRPRSRERRLGRRLADPRAPLAGARHRAARRSGSPACRPRASPRSPGARGAAGRGGRPGYRLDGDNLRHGLNANLGFSAEDRAENVRRTAHAARLLADAGVIAIVSLVSPYAADRAAARAAHDETGLEFVEVWVNTPLEECERRDPKGLYAKARAGEITGFTGVDDPYEAPESPDLELGMGAIEDAVERAWALLVRRGIVSGG